MQRARNGLISGQFIEIIEWIDTTNDTIIHKFPDNDSQIKNGAQLIVRESQVAIFLNEGQMGDVFRPGTHTLSTSNIPVLSSLKGWKYGFESPFKADVYFVSTKQFTGFRWGTANPILMRDAEFGVVRLRAFGNYAFLISDAPKFFWEIAGTNPTVTTESVQSYLRSMIVTVFTDTLASARIPALDLSSKYQELSRLTLGNAQERFRDIGLALSGFTVESIALTEDVERYVDKRSSMNVIGDLDRYAKFQTADAIPEALANPGGIAALGAGLTLGNEIAKALGGTLITPPANANPPASPASGPSQLVCSKCNTSLPANAVFCLNCGQKVKQDTCPKCGESIIAGARFCLKCGEKLV